MKHVSLSHMIRRVVLKIAYAIGVRIGINQRAVSVLCYHSMSRSNYYSVAPEEFRRQMERIARIGGAFVSLDTVMDIIEGRKTISGPAFAITVDDGYCDIQKILPTIKRFRIPLTLFVLAKPQHAQRHVLKHPGQLLSYRQLRALMKKGMTIGCHSSTHPLFNTISEDMLQEEIAGAKQLLERHLRTTISYFAYPKGLWTTQIRDMVQRTGYRAAYTVYPQSISPGLDRYILPRVIVSSIHKASDFPTVFSPSAYILQRIERMVTFIKGKRHWWSKPTMLQLLHGFFLTCFGKQLKGRIHTTPFRIDRYKLITPILRQRQTEYSVGLYHAERKKYVIKTWEGKWRNLPYYLLKSEYRIGRLLYMKADVLKKHIQLSVPRTVEIVETKNRLSVVTDYISGKTLNLYSVRKQAHVLATLLKDLDYLSKSLTSEEQKIFPYRGIGFYLLSFPFYTTVRFLLSPGSRKNIFQIFFQGLRYVTDLRNYSLSLSHGDLCPDNILLVGNKPYMIDLGAMTMTFRERDISYLSINPLIPKNLVTHLKAYGFQVSRFFRVYMNIQYNQIVRIPVQEERI